MCRSNQRGLAGFVYDCDFNQMLDMPLLASDRTKIHLQDLMNKDIRRQPSRSPIIVTAVPPDRAAAVAAHFPETPLPTFMQISFIIPS